MMQRILDHLGLPTAVARPARASAPVPRPLASRRRRRSVRALLIGATSVGTPEVRPLAGRTRVSRDPSGRHRHHRRGIWAARRPREPAAAQGLIRPRRLTPETPLISPQSIFGLEAPLFAWLAAFVLVFFTASVLVQFCWKVWRQTRRHRNTTTKLQAIASDYPLAPGQGLPLRGFTAAAEIVYGVPALRRAWTDLRSQCVLRRNADGEDQYWASRSAEAAFTEAAITDPELDRAFYAAIPGIVTSTGLLFTFLAILVALLDVEIENEQVKGLNLLLPGGHSLTGGHHSSGGAACRDRGYYAACSSAA